MGLLDADKNQRLERFGEDTCDLLDAIEQFFGLEFTDDELIAAGTVGLLSRCISRKLVESSRSTSGWASTEVFPKLRQLIAEEIGMKGERIAPETAFPEGLKIF